MATRVKLLRPLDGRDTGSTAEYSDADAKRLAARGAVEILSDKVEKAAPTPANKMAPAVQNKAAAPVRGKKGR
ncbi:MAG: hypothetical protein ACOH2M_08855 [Cypionkella sp.]